MSQYGYGRSRGGDYDEPPSPQRWDREKFEAMSRSRGPPVAERERERDTIRFEERDTYSPRRGSRRDIEIDIRERERETPRRGSRRDFVEERETFREDDFERRPGRRPEFLDRAERDETEGRELTFYRKPRMEVYEHDRIDRDYGPPARRPGLLRRQSSLDTFDRRAPRYDEEYRFEEYRRRAPAYPPRREHFYEDEYEGFWEDDYRDVRVHRDRAGPRRRRPRPQSHVSSSRRSSSESFEEEEETEEFKEEVKSSRGGESVKEEFKEEKIEKKVGKKGKTKFPKRLVKKEAIIELGYEFDEEDDFFMVRRALQKEHIDEVIELSAKYKEPSVTTYKFEEKKVTETETEGRSPSHHHSHRHVRLPSISAASSRTAVGEEVIEEKESKTEIIEPSRRSHRSHSHSGSRRAMSPREVISESKTEVIEEVGPGALMVLPHRQHRTEREIAEEIQQLRREGRAVRLEREADLRLIEADRIREDYDVEVVEPAGRDVIRVEKDRKGRLALVRSKH